MIDSPTYSADTVPKLLEERTTASPKAVAFQHETTPGNWTPVTWDAFGHRVEQLRRSLAAAGLRPGDRLAIIAPVSLEWELLQHAALCLGVIVVGLDVHDLPERIAGMVELADVTACATSSPRVLTQLGADRWANCRLALQLGKSADDWPTAAAKPMTWAAFESLGVDDPGLPPPGPSDLAAIIFTSGTTGAPKGIAYRHEQVCLAISGICEAFSFVGPGSRLLCWLPLSNLFQRIVNLAGMCQGAASYLLGDPRRVMEVVAGVAPDVFIGVPRYYEKLYAGIRERVQAQPAWRRRLVEWAWQTGRLSSPHRQVLQPLPIGLGLAWAVADLIVLRHLRSVMGSRLQCMVTGSAPTPTYLLEEFHALGWLLLEAYGLSENVVPIAMNRIGQFKFGSVGRPMPGIMIEVRADEAIMVRGPGLFSGYLGEPRNARLVSDGYYVTGDTGRLDSDGYLSVTGRSNDIFKTSTGRRVVPAAIEAQLQRVLAIDQAMVFGAGRKCVVALCTYDGTSVGASHRLQLESALRELVAGMGDHDRPRAIALIDRPFRVERGEMTANLKLVRTKIEYRYAALIENMYDLTDSQKGVRERDFVLVHVRGDPAWARVAERPPERIV